MTAWYRVAIPLGVSAPPATDRNAAGTVCATAHGHIVFVLKSPPTVPAVALGSPVSSRTRCWCWWRRRRRRG